jgi:putative redox protein
MTIHGQTETSGRVAQSIQLGAHTLRADMTADEGGDGSAPSPHDYFDASLAACKALTAHWYAKRNNMELERVEVDVTRDGSEERKGRYVLKVKLTFHGNLSDEQRTKLHAAVARCPVHKLMTTTDVVIETEPG